VVILHGHLANETDSPTSGARGGLNTNLGQFNRTIQLEIARAKVTALAEFRKPSGNALTLFYL
jgi:hypothetical protein